MPERFVRSIYQLKLDADSNSAGTPIPKYARFVLGGVAGCTATCFTQPFDLIKNRMQMSGQGGTKKLYRHTFHAMSDIVQREGFFGLYNGLSAGLLRQATYTTVRLGGYSFFLEKLESENKPPSIMLKAFCGFMGGACGGLAGNPADIAMVRMTSDGLLPLDKRRNYRHVGDALIRIVREEGASAVWTGAVPTMVRAMIANAVQLPSYSVAKELLIGTGYFEDNVHVHIWSSMIAGFLCSAAAIPIDIAKTRIQYMKVVPGQPPEYTGLFDAIHKVVKYEGVSALWKGFTPYYARLGPQTVLVFVFLERFTTWYRKHILGDKSGKGTGF